MKGKKNNNQCNDDIVCTTLDSYSEKQVITKRFAKMTKWVMLLSQVIKIADINQLSRSFS